MDEVPNASIVTVTLSANQSKATVSIGNNNLPKTGAIWRPAEITIPKRTYVCTGVIWIACRAESL